MFFFILKIWWLGVLLHGWDSFRPVKTNQDVVAFPGAEGFGKYTTGGRGGRVIKVTNLLDSGPGSFRAAVEASGPRIVVFTISGTIRLKSKLAIRNGNITIAGQTAPGDGICIRDYPFEVSSDNVIIRFMRFRLGDEAGREGDSIGGRYRKNVIIDHCSVSWATDECMSFYSNEDLTVQWCLISEGLRNSVHEKGTHSYGAIWGGKRSSFHHNLLAHHDSRMPRLGDIHEVALSSLIDIRNNVVYNWWHNNAYGGEAANANIVNCYYKPGPASFNRERIMSIGKELDSGDEIENVWGKYYINGNYVDGSPRATADNWQFGVYNQFDKKFGAVPLAEQLAMRLESPHNFENNVFTHTAHQAYNLVLAFAGASLRRDDVDKRIIRNVREGTFDFQASKGSRNGIIDSQSDVGGWPALESEKPAPDTDDDGMPDAWETAHGLNPLAGDASGRSLDQIYDNIEVYINSLVTDIQRRKVTNGVAPE